MLFLSSCGPWCQKTLILSWFALFLSLLRFVESVFLYPALVSKNSALMIPKSLFFCCVYQCFMNIALQSLWMPVSSVLFFCLLVGLGLSRQKVSSLTFTPPPPPPQQNLPGRNSKRYSSLSVIKIELFVYLSHLCALSVFLKTQGLGVIKNSHLKLICFVFSKVSSVLSKSSFVFLWALVSKNSHLKLICLFCFCLFCALSVFLWALVSKNSHLKLICFVSVSSVLFLSSCGPWCQENSP